MKVLLEEVFGATGPSTEICWKRVTAHGDSKRWGVVHDLIIWHAKTERFIWNPQFEPYDPKYLDAKYSNLTQDGRRYMLDNLTSPHARPNMTYEWRGHKPPPFGWRYEYETMERLYAEGRIELAKKDGGRPRLRRFLDEMPGVPVGTVWSDVSPVNSQAREDTGYDTQKPETLLERAIRAFSDEGDLVLDCFCGSGTTPAVAERLGRRWIAADLGRFAIHTTRKRLLQIPGVRPFTVQNLGKYERQAWQSAEFGEQAEARMFAYRSFILDLYRARSLAGYAWLHGVKNGRLVHVGAVDSPVSVGDVQQIALEFRRAAGSGKDAPTSNSVDVLGWDFAFEVNEVARQQAALANIDLRFVRIPREVLEKKAVEQGDIRFLELAALSVEAKTERRAVTLTLADFVIPVDDVPEDVQRAITHWTQWIDYWAVDWDFKGDTFHNQWQSYRTRKSKELLRSARYAYEAPGDYAVVVKVIDILGNDTTKTLQVKVT